MCSKVITKFVVTSTEAVRGLITFEASHRSVSSLDPAMVLLNSMVQILTGSMCHAFAEFSADRTWVTIVTIRGDPGGSGPGHRFGRSKERFRRFHVACLAQPHIHQRAVTINGTIKIAPAALDLDVGLVDVPTSPDPAFTPLSQTVDQRRGELRLPVSNGFMTELNPAKQEHLGQIAQAELVSQAPEHHENYDIGGILAPVQNSATALVELLATGATPEAPVTPSRTIRPFRDRRRVASDAPHFADPPPEAGS
jgi:hypothetical protein